MAFADWPIRHKLTTMFVGVSAAALLLMAGTFVVAQILRIRTGTRRNLETYSQIIAANGTASLAFANEADAKEILAALHADPHVRRAAIYDRNGRIFAVFPHDSVRTLLPPAVPADGFRYEGTMLVGVLPMTEKGSTRLGTLYLVSDTAALTDALRTTISIVCSVLIVALLSAYVLANVMQRRISGPVLALADTARAVSERGDYAVRAAVGAHDEVGRLTAAFNQMLAHIEGQERTLRANADELATYTAALEQRVLERTQELVDRNEVLRKNAAELQAANTELDAFAYAVSHDLRAPLRSIDGFSMVLLEDYATFLDEGGHDALRRVRAASQRMGFLIDDLLKLSRVTRSELRMEDVDLSALAEDIATELQRGTPARKGEFVIAPGLHVHGDARLLRVVLENLLGNAWKYSGRKDYARVELGVGTDGGRRVFHVRDNGAGFDMAYANKLFAAFQRLHSTAEFEGTGIGLATVRRVIARHGGDVWAEGAVDQGATFYFTI